MEVVEKVLKLKLKKELVFVWYWYKKNIKVRNSSLEGRGFLFNERRREKMQ